MMRQMLRPILLGIAPFLPLAVPASAAAPDLAAELRNFVGRIESSTQGVVKWEGLDRMVVRQEGDASIAVLTDARIVITNPAKLDKPPKPAAEIGLDRIEVRRAPGSDGSLQFSISLPHRAVLHVEDDNNEVTLTLDEPKAHARLDAQSEHTREWDLGFAKARIDEKKGGDWVTLGPLASSYRVVAAGDGSWTSPSSFELKSIEFFSAQGPASGTIDRIGIKGEAAGPDLAAADRLRDRLTAAQQGDLSPSDRMSAVLSALPGLLSAYSRSNMEFSIAGITVRKPGGPPLFSLAKAGFEASATGLSGEMAAVRLTLKHDGLAVDASVPEAKRVPHRGIFDIGLEEIGTTSLRTILESAVTLSEATNEADKPVAMGRIIGAAAVLRPLLRIYDVGFDLDDFGLDLSAEARGSVLSRSYNAEGDLTVRGIDALHDLAGDAPLVAYLPLLKELGAPATAADGTPRTKFHLVSAPPKWLTVNGNNVSKWFAASPPAPGEPRLLRPAEPPLNGADVRAVQRALADAGIAVPQNGVYDPATAVAVTRFEKKKGLDVDGVVDAAVRDRLGIKTEPSQPHPGPAPEPEGRR